MLKNTFTKCAGSAAQIRLSIQLFAKDRDNIAAFAVEELRKLIAQRNTKIVAD